MNPSRSVAEGKKERNMGIKEKKREDNGFSDVQIFFIKKVVPEWFEGITSSTLNLAFISKGFAVDVSFWNLSEEYWIAN